MQHLNFHSYQIIFLAYCAFHLIFLFRERDFITESLKQGTVSSSTRLGGFMVNNAVILAFMYDSLKNGLDYHKLIAMLLFSLLMYGVVRWAELMELKNSNSTPTVINNILPTPLQNTNTPTGEEKKDDFESQPVA